MLHLLLQCIFCSRLCLLSCLLRFLQRSVAFLLKALYLRSILFRSRLQEIELILQVGDHGVLILPLKGQDGSPEDLAHANLGGLFGHLLAVSPCSCKLLLQFGDALFLGFHIRASVFLDLQQLQSYRVSCLLQALDLAQTSLHQHGQSVFLLLGNVGVMGLVGGAGLQQLDQLPLLRHSCLGAAELLYLRLKAVDLCVELLQLRITVTLLRLELLHFRLELFDGGVEIHCTRLGASKADSYVRLGVGLHLFKSLLRICNLRVCRSKLLLPLAAFFLNLLATHRCKLCLKLGILFLQLLNELSSGVQLLLDLDWHLLRIVSESKRRQRVIVVYVSWRQGCNHHRDSVATQALGQKPRELVRVVDPLTLAELHQALSKSRQRLIDGNALFEANASQACVVSSFTAGQIHQAQF
mmetsp:Transcript_5741/g.13484  ORF Transcript_5741/g.13484 Transcript_5741/m.13484 type:complete len:411 (-) Transcript_5741:188-1420(-)